MYQWRKFEFFEEKYCGKYKVPDKITAEIQCCSSGRGKVAIGCDDGTVSLLDRGLKFNYAFHAHSSSVLFLQQLKEYHITRTVADCPGKQWRLGRSRTLLSGNYTEWFQCSSARVDAITTDVVAPSPWKLIGCDNGLRIFREAKNEVHSKAWDDHPSIMAVGVMNGTSEAIFQTLMSLGSSRSEWDFCFHRGSVVERLDGHTDIIHKQLDRDWLPWGMQYRDLLLRRYWRREDDGTYVILYHSVYHKKCPPQEGYIRACLKSGGYVICPANRGN